MDRNTLNTAGAPGRLYSWALVVVFALLILTPSLAQIAGIGKQSGENRSLAEFPTLRSAKEIKDLTQKMDAYVNDRFGLRRQLVRLNSLIRFKLGISSSKDVVIGEDGWLFYTADSLMEQHTGADVFTPAELDTWIDWIQSVRGCLVERDIAFYFIIAPDKNTIYPEKLPDYPRPPTATTRFDQVVNRLRRTNIDFIDPREAMFEAKAQGIPIYHGGDTHWTKQGAYVAYELFMDQLRRRFPSIVPVTLADFDVGDSQRMASDLAVLLALDRVIEYKVETLERDTPSHLAEKPVRSMKPGWGWPVLEWHNDLASQPRLLVFGDSFTDYILGPNFLYETFGDPVFTHHNNGTLNLNLIEEFNPDVVVLEMADRYLHRLPLKPLGYDHVCRGAKYLGAGSN